MKFGILILAHILIVSIGVAVAAYSTSHPYWGAFAVAVAITMALAIWDTIHTTSHE